MIAIVDYGMGNVASVANMLKRIGANETVLSRDPEVLLRADKLILPGVGAFDKGMQNLEDFGLLPALHEAAIENRIPVLGICLGSASSLLSRAKKAHAPASDGLTRRRCVFVFLPNPVSRFHTWAGATSILRGTIR